MQLLGCFAKCNKHADKEGLGRSDGGSRQPSRSLIDGRALGLELQSDNPLKLLTNNNLSQFRRISDLEMSRCNFIEGGNFGRSTGFIE
jgi:hypothetical protein